MYLHEDDESQIDEELIEVAEGRPITPNAEFSSDEEEFQEEDANEHIYCSLDNFSWGISPERIYLAHLFQPGEILLENFWIKT